MADDKALQRDARARRLPPGVWVLGFVSLLMDVSSEMVHCLLPVFMVGTLGVSVTAVGFVEGIAEATALIAKVISGPLADALGRRKPLAIAGYALGAATKPFFAIASGVGTVLAARFVDRIGKGIRGAPRDALVADLTAPPVRGAAFGLRQSLDSVGAVAGPLLASALMLAWHDDIRAVFWVAVVPGVLSVVLLAAGVREPKRADGERRTNPLRRAALKRLGAAYRGVVVVGAVFALARFSEAFLVLRAQQLGVPAAALPLVMVAMSAVYALTAYPVGALSDRVGPRGLLGGGLAVLIAADAALAAADGWVLLGLGVALWGAHMGMTQGLLAAMVADAAPADLRGTAFGFFNLASGAAMLAASAIAGMSWDIFGAAATFWTGAGFASLAGIALWRHAAISPKPEPD